METLETFLAGIIEPWKGIRRWQGRPDAKFENDLMHSWKTVMQALVLLAIEREISGKTKNYELCILTLALIHDISEACLGGDVIAPIKKDSRLAGVIDVIEAEEFDRYISELPPQSADFLKAINHLQGKKELAEGRFFEMVELIGYASFALAEIAAKKSANNTAEFLYILNDKHPRLKELMQEFRSVEALYGGFIPFVDAGGDGELGTWNLEYLLRGIIDTWETTMAWPGMMVTETVLERTMKTALLAAILVPLEINLRKGKRKKTQLKGFDVLACSVIFNIAKSKTGVLPFKLKVHPSFPREKAREIETEKFSESVKEFPEQARILMERIFCIKSDVGTLEGRFFSAIKNYSYLLFALAEYKRDNAQFLDVLKRCYPVFVEHSEGFECFDAFSSHQSFLYEIKSIIDGKSRL
jgi:5'-deoxynucleotidase YfbR-like HD superfamily hydrolase